MKENKYIVLTRHGAFEIDGATRLHAISRVVASFARDDRMNFNPDEVLRWSVRRIDNEKGEEK